MSKNREQVQNSCLQKQSEFVDTSCYIYEIPYSLYQAVCDLLDENTPWAQIAKEMQFNELELLVSLPYFLWFIKKMQNVRLK